mgnify:CR=1 FL=1
MKKILIIVVAVFAVIFIYKKLRPTVTETPITGYQAIVTSVENGNILFAFMDSVLLKDDYFNMMDKTFGPYVSSELVNYYNTLYDKEIKVVFRKFVRDEKKFDSVDELTKQIKSDVEYVLNYLGE